MENKFICGRCSNSDEKYLGIGVDGKVYCRRCLPFSGTKVDPSAFTISPMSSPKLRLAYPLTEKQEEIAVKVRESYKKNIPVLINAVTGAGKTELVYMAMEEALKEGKRVGFATPRKDVVLELGPRIEEAFPSAKVVCVCEGHTEDLYGHIIVLTSHQLYRYPHYFDLLVFDEIDAFPYRGDELLHKFFKDSIRGTYVLLSATPSKDDLNFIEKEKGIVLKLDERYHGRPLPVPVFKRCLFFQFLYVLLDLKRMLNQGKQVFVFAPTIREVETLYEKLSLFLSNGESVSSQDGDREKKIREFKEGKLRYLVTTSILERGVTVKNLQVLVYKADTNYIYNADTLIQIAGRAGRKKKYEDGEVVFYGAIKNKYIIESIERIKKSNGEQVL